ncbi:transposable element Tcb2 transposase [Trichonephila clavipes]|nr:transposable element Tcb2 transposase [Trichonephila clavipes]
MDILQPHVLPLLQQLLGAIFQQDNDRPHTTRVSQDCLRIVSTLPWPARSPDFSPIEHICGGELKIMIENWVENIERLRSTGVGDSICISRMQGYREIQSCLTSRRALLSDIKEIANP